MIEFMHFSDSLLQQKKLQKKATMATLFKLTVSF